LKSLPSEAGYDDTAFCKADFGLVRIRLDSVHGFIFITFNPDAPPLAEYLGDAVAALGDVAADGLEVFHYHQQDVTTNWKLFAENDREGYHTYLHYLNLRTHGYMQQEEGDAPHSWRSLGNGHMIFGDHKRAALRYDNAEFTGGQDLTREPLGRMAERGQFLLYIFPDVFVNVRSNVMRLNRFIPEGPGRTLVEFRGLAPIDDTPELRNVRRQNHNMVWGYFGLVLSEDVQAVERQWETMAFRGLNWSLVARHLNHEWEDDVSLREFYAAWSKYMGEPSSPRPDAPATDLARESVGAE
jgi:phenylpropionate dioxygenase-like ring-hydroxylating dioxygenase large terminal subunit